MKSSQPPRRSHYLVIGAAATLLALYVLFPSTESATGPHLRPNGSKSRLTSVPERMDFLIVTDLDKKSADATSKKPRWKAYLKKVPLHLHLQW